MALLAPFALVLAGLYQTMVVVPSCYGEFYVDRKEAILFVALNARPVLAVLWWLRGPADAGRDGLNLQRCCHSPA